MGHVTVITPSFRFLLFFKFFDFDKLFGGLVHWFTVEQFRLLYGSCISRECSTATSTITEMFRSSCVSCRTQSHIGRD